MSNPDIEEASFIDPDQSGQHYFGDEEKYPAYFKDNIRRVDFILEYEDEGKKDANDDSEVKKIDDREMFCDNLKKEGLELETVYLSEKRNEYGTFDQNDEEESKVAFIQVHAPFKVLCKYARITKMKLPVAPNDIEIEQGCCGNYLSRVQEKIDPFIIRKPQFTEPPSYFVEGFDEKKIDKFIHAKNEDGTVNQDAFFTPAERNRLIFFILARTPYGTDADEFGIKHLEYKDVFVDAYPLHDGPTIEDYTKPPDNYRQKLQVDWARTGRIFKYQPISAIRQYFGESIALYFAWIGVYTSFLLPAAIIGILCFLYGISNISSDIPTKETCTSIQVNNTYLFFMCPICNKVCSYYLLNTTCTYAKLSRAFDNQSTIFFSIFMSVWATLFLEFWKRKQVTLAYNWHAMDFEEEEERPRPEYKLNTDIKRINQVDKKEEPAMSNARKYLRLVGAYSVVAFFFCIVVAAIVGVIIYRAVAAYFLSSSSSTIIKARYTIIVSATAATINLICINILKLLYGRIADKLTDWENPRTRTDYEDSYTIKMFWFQFANMYASIFYVAFFKGNFFTGTPAHQNKVFGTVKLEGCSAEGCFIGLTVQLIIIMVGQQMIGNFKEILIPYIKKKMIQRNIAKKMEGGNKEHQIMPQWMLDYECKENEEHALFDQYLEIVLQYGFVTMFVAAFPLAPFFALLNNIIEIRLDAINIVCFYRRPVSQRAEDIGSWYTILSTLTTLSTIVNAFVIAFTSDFIPRTVYRYKYSTDGTLNGYVNFTLSYFNVKDFTTTEAPEASKLNGFNQSYCRYAGYYQPQAPYDNSEAYWVLLAARFGFVICFQAIVLTVNSIVAYIIPDIPESLSLKLMREEYLLREEEMEREDVVL